MHPEELVEQLEGEQGLDGAVEALAGIVDDLLPEGPIRDALRGRWLGHPLHPVLTDLPIGFWTSAWVLDLLPGRRFRPAADALIALGLASAVPTVAAGLADWRAFDDAGKRVGVVHAASNAAATALYAWSLLDRARGRRLRGVALAMAGATAATVGGYLGGHLSFPDGPVADPAS